MDTITCRNWLCYCITTVSVVIAVDASAQDQVPKVNPKEVHNLRSTTTDSWIIYAWTDAISHRPAEPIGLYLRFVTETSAKFEQPDIDLIVTDSAGKVVEKRTITIKTSQKADGVINLHHWKTDNLIPDPGDSKKSILRIKDKYTIRLHLKYKDGTTAIIDKIVVDVGR
jgi:hypothetical protein